MNRPFKYCALTTGHVVCVGSLQCWTAWVRKTTTGDADMKATGKAIQVHSGLFPGSYQSNAFLYYKHMQTVFKFQQEAGALEETPEEGEATTGARTQVTVQDQDALEAGPLVQVPQGRRRRI